MISYQIEEYDSTKNSTHLHCFDLRVWRFSPMRSSIWLYNICKVSVPHNIHPYLKPHIIFLEVAWSKEKAKIFKYSLVRNHLQIWVTWANHSRNKSYLYVFKIMQKPKFLSMNNIRRFESKLFCFSITQVKALVWFWLIDETLSANLVYQDDYEIGSTTPSDEAMAKSWQWWWHGDGQMLKLGKEEREKQKAQGKCIKCRSHFVLVIKTLSECDHI